MAVTIQNHLNVYNETIWGNLYLTYYFSSFFFLLKLTPEKGQVQGILANEGRSENRMNDYAKIGERVFQVEG